MTARRQLPDDLVQRAIRAALTPQGWAVAWQEGTVDLDEATVHWLRALPAHLHDLAIRFPPSCLVQALVPLAIPVQGTVGIVTSYQNDGTLTVRQEPEAPVRAQCRPDELEVVGYYRDLTPERMARVFAGGA